METAKPKENLSSPSRLSIGGVIWLVISQLLAALSLIPWLMVAGLSVMAFDSGVSTEAVLFVSFIWSYPLFVIGLAITAWVLFAFKKIKAALIITSLPLLPALGLLAYFGSIWVFNIFG